MKNWTIKKLGEVCEFIGGSQPPKTDFSYIEKENYIRLIQIRDYKSDSHIVYIPKNKARRFCNSSDIMIGRYGPPVFQILKGLDGAYNVALMKAVPDETVISKEYAYLFLKYSKIQEFVIHLSQRAAGQTGVNKEAIEDYPISLPPLPEQQRIVAILDEAFVAIAKAKENAERNLRNAKELFDSYLQGVFEEKREGWKKKTLGEICEICSKLIDPKKSEFQNLIHVGAGNIESQKGTLIDLKTAKEENLISGKFLFDESMVLYSKIRPYLIKVVKCEFKGLCSADIYPLVPFKDELTRDFLYYLLLTQNFTDYAILGSQRAGMPKVNREHLFAYNLHVPSIKVQQSIVQRLDTLSAETQKLEAIYQQKINDLEEMKKSILQKAFSGGLNYDSFD